MSSDMGSTGYSKEEEFFFRHNQDLLEKRRLTLEKERKEREAREGRAPYWMVCPKCGGPMKEIELVAIMVDRCSHCKGIYFDRGELELLLESEVQESFLEIMKTRLH